MTGLLASYAEVAGKDVVKHLRQLAAPLKTKKVVHVNSTRSGGGVAEILTKLVPLMRDLDIDASWEIVTGDPDFYQCTKSIHNALQGHPGPILPTLIKAYEKTSAENAERLRPVLQDADVVIIHDPQPALLLSHCPDRKGMWIWRCHIDVSRPYRPVWKYLRPFVEGYDASIFSLAAFTQQLPHPQYLIPPSIDPLSEKNMPLETRNVTETVRRFGIDPAAPMILQVSRFDRFKDPIGVIEAYRMANSFVPDLQLVLAGGTASDDPEGEAVLEEVRQAAQGDPDVHILLLPPDSHREINALQRAADIILQKSKREGFGLTVTEGLWKGKPVIGGATGGICLQVANHHTGFLVSTPQGAAMRIRYLFRHRDKIEEMGAKAREFVRENFLLTRQLQDLLTLMVGLMSKAEDRIELG